MCASAALASCTVVTSEPRDDAAGTGGSGGADVGGSAAGHEAEAGDQAIAGDGSGAAGNGSGGEPTVGAGGAGSVTLTSWKKATGNLTSLQSVCGNLTFVTTKPGEDSLIANVYSQGLWSSADGGESWQPLGTAVGSDQIKHGTSSILFDPLDPNHFWESGIYGPAVYRTTDGGESLTQLGDAQHCDLVGVDFGDPGRKTLLCGGHEQSKTVNLSTDGGKTWSPVGSPLPDKTNCTMPVVIDEKTFLVGCGGYGGGVTGIYRSTDTGKSWTVASTSGGGWLPLLASDGSIYWPNPYPGGLTRSTDHGKTWKAFATADQVSGNSPVELPDGRIAATKGDHVVVSSDKGATWPPVTGPVTYTDGEPRGLAYSAQQKAFFVWHQTCEMAPVRADAILRAAFDYKKK